MVTQGFVAQRFARRLIGTKEKEQTDECVVELPQLALSSSLGYLLCLGWVAFIGPRLASSDSLSTSAPAHTPTSASTSNYYYTASF